MNIDTLPAKVRILPSSKIRIKATTAEEREVLLAELQKGGFKVDVTTSQSLGMKADLNIPWSKLRVIRRYGN